MASSDAMALSDLVGDDHAMTLAQMADSSRWLYVPKRMTRTHRIAMAIGYDNALKVSAEFPGMAICISTNRNELARRYRDQSIVEMMREGRKPELVAWMHSVSRTRVYEILNQYYQNP